MEKMRKIESLEDLCKERERLTGLVEKLEGGLQQEFQEINQKFKPVFSILEVFKNKSVVSTIVPLLPLAGIFKRNKLVWTLAELLISGIKNRFKKPDCEKSAIM